MKIAKKYPDRSKSHILPNDHIAKTRIKRTLVTHHKPSVNELSSSAS